MGNKDESGLRLYSLKVDTTKRHKDGSYMIIATDVEYGPGTDRWDACRRYQERLDNDINKSIKNLERIAHSPWEVDVEGYQILIKIDKKKRQKRGFSRTR